MITWLTPCGNFRCQVFFVLRLCSIIAIMTTLAKQIGNRIKAARLAADMTQEEMAAPLGIGRAAYSNIENGHSLITVDHLLKLPHILHKPVSYFLDIERETLSTDEVEWLEIYRLLPGDIKALVLTFAKAALQQADERD